MSEWGGRKVLVTGATGYIGGHLVSALRLRDVSVCALVRRSAFDRSYHLDAAPVAGDLMDASSLTNICKGIDTVFHLAGYAHADDASVGAAELHWRLSVDGTQALLDDAKRHQVKRIVFLSSVKAMGEGGDDVLDEAATPRPTTPYGQAKLMAENLVLQSAAESGAHACVLRLPLVYGRNNKGNLARMLAAVAKGRFPPVPQINNRRSMIHVDDVIQALLLSVQPPSNGQRYIVTDGVPCSTRQIYDWMRDALGLARRRWAMPVQMLHAAAKIADGLQAVTGRQLPFNSDRLEKLLGSACYRSDKIVRELAFRPTRTFKESLPEMIAELDIRT